MDQTTGESGMKYLTLLVMILSSFPVGAGEYKVLVGSYHMPRSDYCEINPGLGYTTDNGFGLMVYRNSECNTGLMWTMTDPINETFSYTVGIAAGYNYAPFMPFASVNMLVGEHGYVGIVPGSLLGAESVIFYGVRF